MNNGKKAIPFISLLLLITIVVISYTFYKTVILDDYNSFNSLVEE
ncbi:MAG TPA: hypothetical protein PK886_01250 [Candidatus Paceibacterota bacterium]|nr:hypothetical protein [Candidatus Paceibacterota bacterium]